MSQSSRSANVLPQLQSSNFLEGEGGEMQRINLKIIFYCLLLPSLNEPSQRKGPPKVWLGASQIKGAPKPELALGPSGLGGS